MVDSTKYVVMDVETNGLSSVRDDLLSISILKPDNWLIFNKLLPLELDKSVRTTHINGIKTEDLSKATALSQIDINKLIEDFELDRRTILIYGNLDERFIKKYFQRHLLQGFEKLNFYNFKRNIISSRFSEGNISKDNLCRLFGIENVSPIHSGVNDCILEWRLFEKLDGNTLLVTNNKVFMFNDEYYIPASYLDNYPNFKYHIKVDFNYAVSVKEIKRFEISGGKIKKFPTNFNGVVIENLINSMLKVNRINSKNILIENKRKLKYIGTLPSERVEVPMILNSKNGTLISVRKQDKKLERELNKFVKTLKKQLKELINYISNIIFEGKHIDSQELILHHREKVLALCDLSTLDAILEIKTNNYNIETNKQQLFYESNGRKCYILQLDWSELPLSISFILSKVEFVKSEIIKAKVDEQKRKEREEKRLKQINELYERINNVDIIITDYVNAYSKIGFRCKKCNSEWSYGIQRITNKPYCPFCANKEKSVQIKNEKQARERENEIRRRTKYFIKLQDYSNGTIQVEEYKGAKETVTARCLICNSEWSIRADHLLERPFCRECKKNNRLKI